MPGSPTPPSPQESNPARQPDLPPRRDEDSPPSPKRFRPNTPPHQPGVDIPDTFHFANIGELTPGRVQNIKAWTAASQPEKTIVWFDRGSRLVNRLNRKMVDYVLKEKLNSPEKLVE